ncbi:MAG: DNA-3-methyladenine glycosylase 2 family protein [Candidatus Marinimicrobia bacterium]|jgi:DNA-3-methyladenine glycosylase II|nr:DNA-3-methyladenine glycosylase 2 family protein [Candidatus Neomarinimicrobiota bacterium]MBT3675526.1 DNA-3-methyladenine glycosylase 2 family protein [Candidatus Neomarinimicrobiota bacterium]MBT3764155.1 DNA-3-methyladenine glycosylase 2 family protein [Candidatus Neomarinimicrobiota bacterium]MBT4067737.1 DNA-3-methyladenine glycosylase 2 family protein [Candidatus Neomarinimicrobiota bacterium]MBT4271603.1 DNA-3-methyladenine glycosylase 2 family protein [Candidatus Neomarinimicrobiota
MNIQKALTDLRKSDPRMGILIDEFGSPEFNPIDNYYESLVRSIVYQQLSGKAAATIYGRFKALFNSKSFPNPNEVMAIPHETLRSVGLSNQKATYILDLSDKWEKEEIDLSNVDEISDEEISVELIKVKGIGQWTADMFLMFTLVRPDVFPLGDLGIQKGFMGLNKMDRLPNPKEMETEAEQWRPYRTVAAWYLWKIVDGPFEW